MRFINEFGSILLVLWLFTVACAQSKVPDPGTLNWHAAKARAEGKTEVVLPWPQIWEARFVSLEDSFAKDSVVVAQLVATKTISNTYEIVTWRKYRVKERLATQPQIPQGPLPDEVPASLLPLATNEFLVPDLGGSVVVDGVRLTQKEPGVVDYKLNDNHLLFLVFRSGGQVALLNYGSHGVLQVDPTSELQPVGNSERSRIWDELSKTGKHNVEALRSWALNRSRSK